MMNQQDIFKKIGNILTELNEQYQFLAQNPAQLNDLEVELFLANADFLADHVRIVQKLNKTVDQVHQVNDHPLLAEQNTIILPENPSSYLKDDEFFDPQELEEVATAEEVEERVDLKQEQEILDDEQIKEETAEEILERDFFKPDQDDHSFEFVLGNHSENDQFDYEAKSVEDIFDRPLSKEEEEILALKKKIHEKDAEHPLAEDELTAIQEDEIGPEPFLIPQEEEVQKTETMEDKPGIKSEDLKIEEPVLAKSEPIAALRDVEMDEPIISPPVMEKPIFTPEAIPVKPTEKPISTVKPQSLNDLLAQTHAKSDEPMKAPIADLKQGISLNEKLLFIKDLFKGYNLAYSEAIDIINRMSKFEDADSFLQNNYAEKNDWASKQATVDQFYELLNRRFSN